MKLFLYKLSIFTGVVAFILSVTLISWVISFEKPAPHFSNSISFNEKMRFIKDNYPPKKINILVLGSSISLNNIHTNSIINKFCTKKYLNTASWGQNMKENYSMLKIFGAIYNPSIVIIASNYMDFYESNKTFDYKILEQYLTTQSIPNIYYYIKTFNLPSFLKESKTLKKYRYSISDYKYLGFDKYGAVSLKAEKFNINPVRWEGLEFKHELLETQQYKYLDSISGFCKKKNIQLLFFQSPFREGYFSKLDNNKLNILNNHTTRIKQILKNNDYFLINSLKDIWADSLFVDYSHLNEDGARIFTEFSIKEFLKMRENKNFRIY